MVKGYWVARVTVTNLDEFKKYAVGASEAVAAFDGRYLARGGVFEAVQGEARDRNVIVEFPSYEAALACWNSPQYQAAKALRDGNCEAEFVVVAGVEA
jgi:uncharacterized protein (DUF1330 family)